MEEKNYRIIRLSLLASTAANGLFGFMGLAFISLAAYLVTLEISKDING